MRLIKVKIPAKWDAGNGHSSSFAYGKAEFSLGLGPCGKTVTALDGYHDEAGYRLQQMHDDGTSKIFYYPARLLIGRVEEEYA